MALSYNLKRERDAKLFAHWKTISSEHIEATGLDRAALIRLQSAIRGRVVVPGQADYDTDRKLSNPLFDEHPQVIVYCEGSGNDVMTALETAREFGLNVRSRSGGHSTAGYSTGPGMLLDVTGMNSSQVFSPIGSSAPAARVQPGCSFGNLNDSLDLYDLHVPGGGCPDVCVAGYMQGGGFGFSSRMLGMNCDRVIGVSMITADGTLVRADEKTNPELFWALRGGTGNQFGVLTEIDYLLAPVSQVWGFALAWPLTSAAEIQQAANGLAVMQEQYMAGDTNGDIGYMTIICGQSDGTPHQADGSHLTPYLLMRGMIITNASQNDQVALKERIAPLTATGAKLQWAAFDTYNMMNHRLLAEPNEIPDFPAGTPMPMENKNARYVGADTVLAVSDWVNLIELVTQEAPNPYYCLVIEPYGGQINKLGKFDTAFIHRDVACDIFLDGFWWREEDRPAVDAWLGKFNTFMKPFWTGHVYQNYPSCELADYRWNYFGDAFPTLLKVKQKYDPHGLFDFPQAIKPIPPNAGPGITVSKAEPLFQNNLRGEVKTG